MHFHQVCNSCVCTTEFSQVRNHNATTHSTCGLCTWHVSRLRKLTCHARAFIKGNGYFSGWPARLHMTAGLGAHSWGCRWCLAHGVRCVNKLLPGAQPRQLYRLTCSDKDYLMDARRQLDRLLRCLVFKHEHAGHLFSHYGRHRMQQLGQTASREGHATVHLHWDNSTRQIRLYGIQADKDWMENQLKALATELAGLQQYEYPIQGRHRRQCIQATPHWCSMEGVVNVRVMG